VHLAGQSSISAHTHRPHAQLRHRHQGHPQGLAAPARGHAASRRNKRQHISNVFSRNEVERDYAYNRALFRRTAHGWYQFNPALAVRARSPSGDESWRSIFAALRPAGTNQIRRHPIARAERTTVGSAAIRARRRHSTLNLIQKSHSSPPKNPRPAPHCGAKTPMPLPLLIWYILSKRLITSKRAVSGWLPATRKEWDTPRLTVW
jgi:hypothetical protein